MKKVHVNILMVILFWATLVSSGHAESSCCDPGAGCCSTSNVSGVQQQPHAFSGAPSQTKVGTANKPLPQINPMPWSAVVNQIGNPQRLAPGAGCCPGTNPTNECCGSQPQSALRHRPSSFAITEVYAFNTFLGTLW